MTNRLQTHPRGYTIGHKIDSVNGDLTGNNLDLNVQSVINAFTTIQDNQNKERRALKSQWAEREKQLERVLIATTEVYVDLQGIVGQGIQSRKGLEHPAPQESQLDHSDAT